MTGWKRWLAWAGAGALVLLLALVGGVAFLVSRLDARAEIERAVEGATGRDFAIRGDVGVSYWPVLGLRATDVALANVAGGRAPALLAADEIDVGVEIQPLFSQRVTIRQLVLQRPRIALEVDANGRPNWLVAPRAAPAPPSRPAPTAPIRETSLRALRFVGGEVSYFDARRGAGWLVGDVDVQTSLSALDRPVAIEGALRYNDRRIAFDARVGAPGAAIRGQLTPLRFSLQSDLLAADFDGRTTAASGEIDGIVNASGPSLRQLAAWTGVPIQGGAGLDAFSLNGRAAFGHGGYAFSNAAFTLDRIEGRGDFVLSQSRGRPYLSGRLELAAFDLNPYLTAQGNAAGVGSAPAAAGPVPGAAAPPRVLDVRAAPGRGGIDFSLLRAFNADLEFITGAVRVQHMRIDRAHLGMVLHDGRLAATLHQLSLYGGGGRGRFEIDAGAQVARIVQDMSFEGVDTRRFLTDAINYPNIEGRGEISLTLRAAGRTQSEMLASADGRIHVEVVSGTLHGVDLGGVASTIRDALRGELVAPEARTQFHGFSATFAVADGVAASDNLSFNTPDLRVPGIGVIDTGRRRLDLRLAPRSPRGGLVVPFTVRGPWTQPDFAADIGGRAQREIAAQVRAVQAQSRAGD